MTVETTATTNPEDKNQQEAEEPKATKENEKETKTKKKENEDYYDTKTNFNPFTVTN